MFILKGICRMYPKIFGLFVSLNNMGVLESKFHIMIYLCDVVFWTFSREIIVFILEKKLCYR